MTSNEESTVAHCEGCLFVPAPKCELVDHVPLGREGQHDTRLKHEKPLFQEYPFKEIGSMLYDSEPLTQNLRFDM